MKSNLRKLFFSGFLSLAVFPLFATAKQLPGPIKFVTDGYSLPKSSYGIYVKEIGATEPILSVNPEKARNPASAIKIATTLAALEILGPAWHWKTEVYTRGKIDNGILHGNLAFKGYGDPYLTTEELWKLLKDLRRKGIKQINGDILIDNNYFDVPYEDPAAFDKKPLRSYNVQPNAFMVNFKAAYFHFSPAKNGRDVLIHVEPELSNLRIENRLRQRNSGCYGFQRGIAVSVPNQPISDRVIFEGRFPARCRQYVMSRTVLAHHTFAFGVIDSLWQQLGGSISGKVGFTTVQEDEKPILVWRSKSLSDVIKLVNKFSNNVMTRHLLFTVGAETAETEAVGTLENGRQAIYDYFTGHDLDISSLHIANGAGLSREVKVSPKLLTDMLEVADRSLFHAEFKSSLSIIGMDGTARKRLTGRKETGHAHVKTGTIDHVSAITGYITAKSGKKYVFAAMLNHENAHRGPGEELMNAIVRWTYRQ